MRKFHYWEKGVLTGLSFVYGASAFGGNFDWVDEQLKAFHANPAKFYHQNDSVLKWDADTLEPASVLSPFSQESIESGDFILQKDQIQKTAQNSAGYATKEVIGPNDQAAALVDQMKLVSLQDIQKEGLMS